MTAIARSRTITGSLRRFAVRVCALLSLATLAAASFSATAQRLALAPVIDGPPEPTGIYSAHDQTGRLFLVSRIGVIWIYDGENMLATPFLDIRDRVNAANSEDGLHGLGFHPAYTTNGFFYLTYTDLQGDSVVARFSVGMDPDVADPDSESILLEIDQPTPRHNVSQLQFGPDGFLYIGAGDGGQAGDPDDRAQDLGQLLGKILRIDVDGGSPYAVPPDNPFTNVPGALPEIWAYGVRNPWRFSFDRLTGDLYIADVGESLWEEVNFQPAVSGGGENYGWRRMEGFHCFDPPSDCFDPTLTLPVLEYPHGEECSITGGFVYRGAFFPHLHGLYFYADWCSGRIWAARRDGDGVWRNRELLDSSLFITTFGEDEDGELYVADSADGRIYRLVDTAPFCDVEMTKNNYIGDDEVIAENLRLVNLGGSDVTARVQLVIQPPVGPVRILFDKGSDGSFRIPARSAEDRGPRTLFSVEPSTPRGTYTLGCVARVPGSGALIARDVASFTVTD